MMNRGENLESIPMDLIPEILSRLPLKSISRFRCVSKLWESIICRQDFAELFYTMSSSKPRLLLVAKQDCGNSRLTTSSESSCCFFSSPQFQNHYGKSSLVKSADLHTKFSGSYFSYASGLFYFTKEYDDHVVRVICNPSTGQYAILPPDLKNCSIRGGNHVGGLGFDPIGKQYKVLVCINGDVDGWVYQILTLGTEKMRWREIKSPLVNGYVYIDSGICINGVLYHFYLDGWYVYMCCFDVRSEKFKLLDVFIYTLRFCEDLINYKGKLCRSSLEYCHDGGFPIELRMLVLEDVEKEEWTTYTYTLSAEHKVVTVNYDLSVVGVIASGEIVLATKRANKPFYVYYFNPDTNTLKSVEIQGVGEEEERSRSPSVYCFIDHVEDLNFDVMKTTTYAATSVRPPEQSTSTSSIDHQVRKVARLE